MSKHQNAGGYDVAGFTSPELAHVSHQIPCETFFERSIFSCTCSSGGVSGHSGPVKCLRGVTVQTDTAGFWKSSGTRCKER